MILDLFMQKRLKFVSIVSIYTTLNIRHFLVSYLFTFLKEDFTFKRGEGMFFFIGGVQPRTVRVEKQARSCPSCAHHEVYTKRVNLYIAIFFIPIIRIKKGPPFTVCENCDALLEGVGTVDRQWGQVCGTCGKFVDDGFSYCPYCGKGI